MKSLKISSELFQRAKAVIPGGVNSPVRAYQSVGMDPPFITRGEGPYLFDADGNRYIDYVLSWGPMILGHAHPKVVAAVQQAAAHGTSFGAPTEAEVELAELVCKRMPHVEMLRLVNSGTEAVMTAARLARGFTQRDLLVKFDGCYHGHSDGFLVKAGSGLATGGIPASRGVPASISAATHSLPYNDFEAVARLFEKRGAEIAAVIVEPVAANMGVVLPESGFLEGLRDLTQKYEALLIFDEVITGFRIARGGASEVFGVIPDLVCLGKILGGGLPIGAVGGKTEIMQNLAPLGDVYQAGTLSGNPISVAAGLATLQELNDPDLYVALKLQTERLAEGLMHEFQRVKVPVQINRITGLLTVYFTTILVNDLTSASQCNTDKFRSFFRGMLSNQIYLPPSPFEAWFLSTLHNETVIEESLKSQHTALKSI
ncbi:MAG: glutamate-1-semialdehyde 2,1-aminomutase [bacterium]|nr:glutamate-1-semialdehyde 2,1-aminomutase [bacterium]